jgi:cytochrome c-type biogenesis protein CcmH/NrfG
MPQLPLHGVLCVAALLVAPVRAVEADAPLAAAQKLIADRQWSQAQAALEQIVTANPKHAAAQFELGKLLARRNDAAALEDALVHLASATELAPDNEHYLALYGGTSLQAAGVFQAKSFTHALGAASKGRAALEKALTMNPDDVDAREWLYQYYAHAPWPIGSSSKAKAQLAEIRKRDVPRAQLLEYGAAMEAKDYPAAFRILDEALTTKPNQPVALFYYGRTAAMTGLNLERGLQCLQTYVATKPSATGWPNAVAAWVRIGNIHEKLKHPDDARAAYAAALQLDPKNKDAVAGAARVK